MRTKCNWPVNGRRIRATDHRRRFHRRRIPGRSPVPPPLARAAAARQPPLARVGVAGQESLATWATYSSQDTLSSRCQTDSSITCACVSRARRGTRTLLTKPRSSTISRSCNDHAGLHGAGFPAPPGCSRRTPTRVAATWQQEIAPAKLNFSFVLVPSCMGDQRRMEACGVVGSRCRSLAAPPSGAAPPCERAPPCLCAQ